MKFSQSVVACIHWNRSKALEPRRMFCDQLGVGVIDHSRNVGLMSGWCEENIGCGQRYNFHINAYAVHIFDALRNIRHRWSDTKEASAAIGDDRLPSGTFSK